jgi:hypothetical protein
LQVCSYNASALVTLLLTILRIQRKPEEPPYRSLESYEPGQNFSAPTMPTVTQAVKEKKVLPHWYFRIGNSGFASPAPQKNACLGKLVANIREHLSSIAPYSIQRVMSIATAPGTKIRRY